VRKFTNVSLYWTCTALLPSDKSAVQLAQQYSSFSDLMLSTNILNVATNPTVKRHITTVSHLHFFVTETRLFLTNVNVQHTLLLVVDHIILLSGTNFLIL